MHPWSSNRNTSGLDQPCHEPSPTHPPLNHLLPGGATFVNRLWANGIKFLRQVLHVDTGECLPAERLPFFPSMCARPASLRILRLDLSCLHDAISSCFTNIFHPATGLIHSSCPNMDALSARPPSPGRVLLDTDTDVLVLTSKTLYSHFNQNLNASQSFPTPWHKLGLFPSTHRVRWREIYSLPTSKKEGDVQ